MESVYTPEYRRFLVQLRKARKEAGLLQAEVARRLGKPQAYVSRCETGQRRVDVDDLIRFAKVYRKPVTFFFQGC